MLTLPVQHPLGFRSAEPTSTAIGGRKAGSRRGAGCNRKHAAHRCYHQPRARRCTVKAAGSSADGGDLPLPAKEVRWCLARASVARLEHAHSSCMHITSDYSLYSAIYFTSIAWFIAVAVS
jgi:hypothetical protein